MSKWMCLRAAPMSVVVSSVLFTVAVCCEGRKARVLCFCHPVGVPEAAYLTSGCVQLWLRKRQCARPIRNHLLPLRLHKFMHRTQT